MRTAIAAFAGGLVFGTGLLLSGMTDPAKVLAFLDLAGPWDPSLAFVMGGAIAVGLVAFARAVRQRDSWWSGPIALPTARTVDRRLVGGSLAFGIGWGLAGLCPGPAIVLLGRGVPEGVVFVGAMLVGMGVFELLERALRGRTSTTS